MNHIAVSILNCDFGALNREIEMINDSSAEWFHLDIMDGVFVPNISFGFPVIQAVKKKATKPLDVHLMIAAADRYITEFAQAGADWLTVHFEACTHLHRTVQNIHQEGMKAGVCLNPHTPVSVLEDMIGDIDLVLLMSVNPGFGGQAFIANTFEKVACLRNMIERKGSKALIEVDGGVDLRNIADLAKAGVDVFVVGSFIFRSTHPLQTIRELTEKSSPKYVI
ncbi:MAG: ribulose-phosphate 3-epimerase [Bacteroidales bacterium]|jgi:ribulose-phosphate 3-epimerase|nr:ribulose-phosphate 3-epimerase [Bacteroidales bacterium]